MLRQRTMGNAEETMQGPIEDWHQQFVRQGQWTEQTRSYLYRRAGLSDAERVLDVGCGTGAITAELARRTRGQVIGIDIDPAMLAYARQHDSSAQYEQGDARDLPYPDGYFDIVTCHYLLLWLNDPYLGVREMARITRRSGHVLVCAEPDYGGRLDWPQLPVREWQIEALRRQGADPCIGRALREMLARAGLETEIGVIASVWDVASMRAQFEAEWAMLWRDAGDSLDRATFEAARARAQAAIEAGTRLVFMPTFYAYARKR
jgi:ubiquinone/menaquinone biosynthesis C-methylase UbiE